MGSERRGRERDGCVRERDRVVREGGRQRERER